VKDDWRVCKKIVCKAKRKTAVIIKEEDLEKAYRFGKANSREPRPILTRFCNYKQIRKLWRINQN